MNALMLLIALRLGSLPMRRLRTAGAAAFGAGVALAARQLCAGWEALLWLPTAAAMMAIACGRQALVRPLRSAALLMCASGLLGGMVLAFSGASGSLAAAYPIGGACALLAAAVARRMRREAEANREIYVECAGIRHRAMLDSGNTLRDYLTQRPVIVLPEASDQARRMIDNLPQRPIFADTAGGRQMMRLAVPKSAAILMDGKRKRVMAVIALAPALDARSPALVPQALLDGNDEGNR